MQVRRLAAHTVDLFKKKKKKKNSYGGELKRTKADI